MTGCAEPGSCPPTCPCLREVVSRRRRLTLPEETYPVDEWSLVEAAFSPHYLPQTETLFCLANGYLGIRATPEEGVPAFEAATFLNGFYETWPIPYGEEAFGLPRTGQSMVPVPDGTVLRLYVDDEPFQLHRTRILAFERRLDFRAGVLLRRVRFETGAGKEFEVRSTRLVSLDDRHLAGIFYEVEVCRGEADVTLSSELLTPAARAASLEARQRPPWPDPRRGRRLGPDVLRATAQRARNLRLLLEFETRSSGLPLSCAMDHRIECDARTEVEEAEVEEDRGRVVVHAALRRGQSLRVDKLLSYHHEAGADPGELRFRTHRTLDRALREGPESLLEAQRRHVVDFFDAADVRIEGEPEAQQAVRFALFHILQATARTEGFGVPAKGLSGSGYDGHYFWDAEMYVVPFLTYTLPRVARSILRRRYEGLDLARERAREVGQRGALFPWRTIDGREASANFATSTAQYHIDADVVYALARHTALTDDLALLTRELPEIAVETARLWEDLGFYSDRRGGRFCINGVTGPDEYNTIVDNNAYTNLMARENLLTAVRLVELLAEHAPAAYRQLRRATHLQEGEPERWRRAAEAMYIPYDEKTGIHLQDDGFLEREPWDFDATPPEHYPLLLHYHPLVIYRHQVIKQADLVMATFLLGDRFTEDEKRRIFDTYDPLTTGDSSLSSCIQSIMACELGYDERAYRYFADAAVMDLGDIGGNVRDGLHIASLAGTWMALVYGFAGLRDRDGRLRFRPALPSGWRGLRFRLRAHGEQLEVELAEGVVRYRLLTGGQLEIEHDGEVLSLTPGRPAERPLPPRPRPATQPLPSRV